MRSIFLGAAIGLMIAVIYGTFSSSARNTVLLRSEPKYKAGDCVAYWMWGKEFKAKEEWEVDRKLPAFMTLEILKVGKEKYLVNTRYRKMSPAPFRPNQSEQIERVDEDYEKIDCSLVESVLEEP